MSLYQLPDQHEVTPGFWKKHGWWILPVLILDAIALVWWLGRRDEEESAPAPPAPEMAGALPEQAPPPPPGLVIGFPTGQTNLLDTNAAGVFMPTASGRPESAMYGSTRTTQQGNAILPSFHEGIDIGPVERDRKQVPLDRIFAIADGRVAYMNRVAGNSNYGRYVVVVHDDPMGEIYSLYSHLHEVTPSLQRGQTVKRGDDLGRMGNTPASIIPVARAHLHIEVGVIMNQRFHDWYKKQKLKPDHGIYHGHNLTGINPLDVFKGQAERDIFTMADYLSHLEPAFTLVVRASKMPDYFVRYPALWTGGAPDGAMVISVAEGGAPLSGRPATAAEKETLGRQSRAVLTANPHVLGRNGLRLVQQRQGQWVVAKNGERWLEILMH